MRMLPQRNDPVRLFGRRLAAVLLFALVVLAGSGAWGAFKKERESAALRKEAEIELADLSERQEQLHSDIGRLTTNRGREEELRQQYALAAKGEERIVIVEPLAAAPIQATTTMFQWFRGLFSR